MKEPSNPCGLVREPRDPGAQETIRRWAIALLAVMNAVCAQGCGADAFTDESSNDERIGSVQQPPTFTFYPSEDAYVDSANPNTNYGADLTLRTSQTQRAYLRFNVNSAITGGVVSSAKLRLYIESGGGTVDGPPVLMATNDTGWTEGTLTWNNQPSPATAGPVMEDKASVTAAQWAEWDVTRQVSGPGVYSFVLDTTGSTDDMVAASSEAVTREPQLQITTTADITTSSFKDGVNGYTGTRDNGIVSGDETANATAAFADVQGSGVGEGSLLLKFDISSLATNRSVAAAKVKLYVSATSNDTFTIYEAEKAWTEAGATWTKWDGSQLWQTAGAKGNDDRDKTPLATFVPNGFGYREITLNSAGLEMVQRWIATPSSNRGLLVVGGGVDGARFQTREGANKPELVVDHRGPCTSPYNELVAGTRAINGPPTEPPPGYPSNTGSYYDEYYGTKIIRVTGSTAAGYHGYSDWSAINADSTRFIIYYDDGPGGATDGWRFYKLDPLTDTVTATNVYLQSTSCVTGEQLIWHHSVPGDFFCTYYGTKQVARCTVTDVSVSRGTVNTVPPPGNWIDPTNKEQYFYQMVVAEDDDTMAFYSRNEGNTHYRAFVYRFSINKIIWYKDYSSNGACPCDLNEVHLDKTGRYVMALLTPSGSNIHETCHVYENTCQTPVTYPGGGGHWAPGRGHTWGDDTQDPTGAGGMISRAFASFGTAIEGWNYLRGGSGTGSGDPRYHSDHPTHNAIDDRWFAVSPFFDTNDNPLNPEWVSWEKELLATNGTTWVRRLAHHHSDWRPDCLDRPTCSLAPACACDPNTEYQDMPKASLSYDGHWLAFSSDYDTVGESEALESDAYILKMPVICAP